MGRSIFISYRRDDTEGEAGRLFDDLTRAFGNDAAFMDVDGIRPGVDFRQAIDENVSGCGVLLAMIGKQWLTIADSQGNRRLDHENDYVRLEIATALARNIAVIPVLVHDARMVHADQLPDNLKNLAYRNSVELTHARWNSDVALLIEALKPYVAPANPADTKPVHATVPTQLPPANPAAAGKALTGEPSSGKGRGRGGLIAVAAAIVAALGIGGYFVSHPKRTDTNPVPVPVVDPLKPTKKDIATDGSEPLLGTWTAERAKQNNSLSRLEIVRGGSGLIMHAWGNCTGPECDWKTCTAPVDNGQLACDYQIKMTPGDSLPARTASVTVRPAGDRLDVMITNKFADRPPNKARLRFDRAR